MVSEPLIDENGNLVREDRNFSTVINRWNFSDGNDILAADLSGNDRLIVDTGGRLRVTGTITTDDIEVEGVMKYDPERNQIIYYDGERWKDMGPPNILEGLPVTHNGN